MTDSDKPLAIVNPSQHIDPRMGYTLADMQRFYNPPQKPFTAVTLTTKREHKSQAESEKDLKSS